MINRQIGDIFAQGEITLPPRTGALITSLNKDGGRDQIVGEITSAAYSPGRKTIIGQALVDSPHFDIGNQLQVVVKNDSYPMTIIQLRSQQN